MEKITCDTILNQLTEWIENKQIISADIWLNSASKLNILRSQEHDKLFDLQQRVAQQKVVFIQNGGMSVAEAKVRSEATDEYREMLKQKAKLDRIEESIRISKTQARLAGEEYRHSNLN